MTGKSSTATSTYERSGRQEQISLVLAALESAWRASPEQRLCQLVVNTIDVTAPQVFYFEDIEVLKKLESA